jgi:hypothetical protein
MGRTETVALMVLTSVLAGTAQAQNRSKGIEVNPVQAQSGIQLALELKARAKSTDEFKTICGESCDRTGPTRLPLGNQVAVGLNGFAVEK